MMPLLTKLENLCVWVLQLCRAYGVGFISRSPPEFVLTKFLTLSHLGFFWRWLAAGSFRRSRLFCRSWLRVPSGRVWQSCRRSWRRSGFRPCRWRRRSRLSGGWKVRQGGEDEFSLAHVVAEVLGFETLQILVGSDADSAPFLMDDVGENGVFTPFLISCVAQ